MNWYYVVKFVPVLVLLSFVIVVIAVNLLPLDDGNYLE